MSMADKGGFHKPSLGRDNKGNLDLRLMVEFVPNHLVGGVAVVFIPMVATQRAVDQTIRILSAPRNWIAFMARS